MALEVGTSTTEEFAFTVITAVHDTVSGVLTHSIHQEETRVSQNTYNYLTMLLVSYIIMHNYATVA